MLDRTGVDTAPQADLAGLEGPVLTEDLRRDASGRAVEVGRQDLEGEKTLEAEVVYAESGVGREMLGQIELGAQGTEEILALVEVPRLSLVEVGTWRIGQRNAGVDAEIRQHTADILILVAEIT